MWAQSSINHTCQDATTEADTKPQQHFLSMETVLNARNAHSVDVANQILDSCWLLFCKLHFHWAECKDRELELSQQT